MLKSFGIPLLALWLLAWPRSSAADLICMDFESFLSAQDGQVVLILDGSNSMWGRVDGTEKIVVARTVLGKVLADLPPELRIGLVAYGHRREKACDDIEVLLSPGQHPRADVDAAIRRVQPRGMTPITAALQMVADGLAAENGPVHVVLVSDGRETCDGDPCALVRALRARGIDLTVHVVGFDVTAAEGEQLRCIAEAGGGTYASAGSAGELTAALSGIRDTVVDDIDLRAAAAVPDRPGDTGDVPSWQFESGDRTYAGEIARAYRMGNRWHIQLVNADAVNLEMQFEGDGAARGQVEHARFAAGRGPSCRLVASDPPFLVTLEPGDAEWLSGHFAGTLACPGDFLTMPVTGSFRVRATGGRR